MILNFFHRNWRFDFFNVFKIFFLVWNYSFLKFDTGICRHLVVPSDSYSTELFHDLHHSTHGLLEIPYLVSIGFPWTALNVTPFRVKVEKISPDCQDRMRNKATIVKFILVFPVEPGGLYTGFCGKKFFPRSTSDLSVDYLQWSRRTSL